MSEGTAHPRSPSRIDAPESASNPPPEQVWAALAPLIAGRPVVRESRDGGRSYPLRWQRPLTTRHPAVPAAVPIYRADGTTRTLVIDLDATRGGPDAVQNDARRIEELVHHAGGRLIADHSPSGGWHLYLPLAEPVPFHDALQVALALAAQAPTMDPAPNYGLTDGLIRPPGARHRSGGHQHLHGALAAAHHLRTVGNPPAVWTKLRAALPPGPQPTAMRNDPDGGLDDPTGPDESTASGPARDLAAGYQRIARTGLYDTSRYASPSEARQAVLTAAACAGLTTGQLLARVQSGAWPGLASFYTRYRHPDTRRKQLLADWRKAQHLVHTHRTRQTPKLVHKNPTSRPPSHRPPRRAPKSHHTDPDEYRFLRTWWTALQLTETDRYPTRAGLARRMVLRALGEAAFKTGSRYIAFGTRSLSIAAGLDYTTVAAHLRALREEPGPFLDLIEDNRRLDGDLYQLRIPDHIAERARYVAWPKGRLHALRPAFRELGLPAALVYEALERRTDAVTSFDLITQVGLPRSTVYQALETLAAFNLASQHNRRWTRNPHTDLTVLPEQSGVADHTRRLIADHRDELWHYRRALRTVDHHNWTTTVSAEHLAEPPPEPQTLLDLLEAVLGAHPIPA